MVITRRDETRTSGIAGRSRVTSKGQVTIPAALREKLGIDPGDEVDFLEHDGVVMVRRHIDEAAFNAAVEKWRGTLDLGGKTSDEYIDEMRGH